MSSYKAALHIDSNYVYHIREYLASGYSSDWKITIEWGKFVSYLQRYIENDLHSNKVVINEMFYYTGSSASLDGTRQVYFHELESAGIRRVSFPLRCAEGRGGLKEDAVDTSLVFNAVKNFYSASKSDRISFFILFAGDSDFVPLVNGLKQEDVKTIVVYYDFINRKSETKTRAAQILLDTADYVINMESLVKERANEEVKSIFIKQNLQDNNDSVKKNYFGQAYQNQSCSQVQGLDNEEVTEDMLKQAIKLSAPNEEGYALGAEVGKKLETLSGKKLPKDRKLKEIISNFGSTFKTREEPAFSVRIEEN